MSNLTALFVVLHDGLRSEDVIMARIAALQHIPIAIIVTKFDIYLNNALVDNPQPLTAKFKADCMSKG